jgi:CheY-like chemotaxis protein
VEISLPLTGRVPEPDAQQSIPAVTVERLRILLVDDEPAVLEIMAELLSEDGHEVETVEEAREGLRRFRAGQFDLVITDRAMPEVSGDRLAALIKQLAPTIPVILLTGFGDLMLAEGERPAGVDLVVAKPVALATLREAIVQVTGAPHCNEPAANGHHQPAAGIPM